MKTILVTLIVLSLAQARANAESSWVALSTKTVNAAKGAVELVLEHADIRSNRDDPCVLIRLRSTTDPSLTFWTACLLHSKIGYPWPQISGSFVSDTVGKSIYIVIGVSKTSDFDVRLFQVKWGGSEGISPIRNREGAITNAKELIANFKTPLNRNSTRFSLDDDCGAYMELVSVDLASGRIRLEAGRKPPPAPRRLVCDPRVLEHNLKSKTWTVIQKGGRTRRFK